MLEKFFSQELDLSLKTGDKIRKIRKRKNKSTKDIADACHITETAVRNYEQGIRQLSEDRLEDVAAALEVDSAALRDRNINSITDVMHTLFDLQDAELVAPFYSPAAGFYGVRATNALLSKAIEAWMTETQELACNHQTKEMYTDWKNSFPTPSRQMSEEIAESDDDFPFEPDPPLNYISNYPYYALVTVLQIKQMLQQYSEEIDLFIEKNADEDLSFKYRTSIKGAVHYIDQEVKRMLRQAQVLSNEQPSAPISTQPSDDDSNTSKSTQ